MFNCYTHGWSHIEKPCPLCHPVETYTSTSTDITLVEKSYPTVWAYEQACKVNEEKTLYIKELEKDNAELKKMYKEDWEELQKLRFENQDLKQGIKDAEYVLQGSRALPKQTDAELEARENALMRFFEVKEKVK